MRIAIVGAGGVGSYFGAALARAGFDVIFIAHGETLAALQVRPLLVHDVAGDFEVHVRATDDPAAAGHIDLILLAVKTYDLDGAAELLRPLLAPETGVLALQNGVDHGDRLAAILGPEAVLPGATFVVTHREAPGVVRRTDPSQRIRFAEYAGGRSERAERIAATLRQAGIDAEVEDDLPSLLWRKLAIVDVTSTLGSLTRKPLGVWLQTAESRDLMLRAAREVEDVAVAKGLPLRGVADEVMATLERVSPELKPSMLVDLEHGRPLEIDAIQGAVIRHGRAAGVPTPVNEFAYAVLRPLHERAMGARESR